MAGDASGNTYDIDPSDPYRWKSCNKEVDGCTGAPVSPYGDCWEHLSSADLIEALGRLRPGVRVDVRGTRLSSTLMERLIRSFQDDDGKGVFGEAWFLGADFVDDVAFDDCVFREVALFDSARFRGEATFLGAKFERPASFSRSVFHEASSFAGATFDEHAYFHECLFHSKVFFTSTNFEKGVSFLDSIFGDLQSYSGAAFMFTHFHTLANFDRARFFGYNTVFMFAEFDGGATFQGTAFGFKSLISSTSFPGTEHFGPVFALGSLDFSDVTFSEPVRFEAAASSMTLMRCNFEQGISLRARRCNLAFDRTTFARPSAVISSPRFLPDAVVPLRLDATDEHNDDETPDPDRKRRNEELSQIFMQGDRSAYKERHNKYAKIEEACEEALTTLHRQRDERARLVSLRDVDVSNLELVDIDLQRCLFDGAYHLDQLGLQGNSSFLDGPKGVHFKWGWPPIWWSTRRKLLAEEAWWRAYREMRGETDARGGKWGGIEFSPPDWIIEHGGRSPERLEPSRLAAMYRTLRKAQEDRKNEPGAADFYYGEMEMRRCSEVTPLGERLILIAYWLFAGYGLRGTRALLALLLVISVSSVLLYNYGFLMSGRSYSLVDTVVYALASSVALPANAAQLSTFGELLRILLRLVGPLLLGLFLLSVRNRIKR